MDTQTPQTPFYNPLPKWAEKILRHRDRIDITNAIKNELGEYIETKIYIYVWKNFMDYILQIVFQEEFKGFAIDNFKRIYIDTRVQLYTHLLKRGVYMGRYNNRYSILEVLFNLF